MKIDLILPLPQGWTSEIEVQEEEDGVEVTHFEAHLPDDAQQTDKAFIDLYVGEMPEDTTPQDQALANYADIVGWDEDEDEDPIVEWPFNGRKAYGFEAYCEDDSPMRIMCFEPKGGLLVVACFIARSDEGLVDLVTMVEKALRVKIVQ